MATTAPIFTADELTAPPAPGQWELVLRRLRRHRLAMLSLFVVLAFFLASLLAPVIAPYAYTQTDLNAQFLAPLSRSASSGNFHLLGTDHLGRDMFSRLLYAGRISLLTALIVTLISSAIGIVLGLLAGYFGGWIDTAITRTLEFISTFPALTILLIVSSMLIKNEDLITLPGPVSAALTAIFAVSELEVKKVALVIVTLSLLGWTGTARLARGVSLALREQTYVDSSRALGASSGHIIARHIFPNSLAPLIVDFTLGINGALVGEAALSFLGFGIQDPTPTWGNILALARERMFNYPWLPIVASMPILIVSLAINYLGDGLRDATDPRR